MSKGQYNADLGDERLQTETEVGRIDLQQDDSILQDSNISYYGGVSQHLPTTPGGLGISSRLPPLTDKTGGVIMEEESEISGKGRHGGDVGDVSKAKAVKEDSHGEVVNPNDPIKYLKEYF